MHEKRLHWAVICGLALAALELMTFYQFNCGSWTWDWTVQAPPAAALRFAAGAALLAALHGLTGGAGARDLRAYWTYCAVLMALCLICPDLDTAQAIFPFAALLTTPLGLVGAALGALPDGAPHALCYGVTLALSAAEALYHHRLLNRHGARGRTAAEGGG